MKSLGRGRGGLWFLIFLLAAAFAGDRAALARGGSPYRTVGACDGLPRMELSTLPGFCVGLVSAELFFPRGLVVLATGDVLVAEMGGWRPNRGAVWLLHRDGASYTHTRLLDHLD